MSEPRTESGRQWMVNRQRYELWHPVDGRRDETLRVILAIEAEAIELLAAGDEHWHRGPGASCSICRFAATERAPAK